MAETCGGCGREMIRSYNSVVDGYEVRRCRCCACAVPPMLQNTEHERDQLADDWHSWGLTHEHRNALGDVLGYEDDARFMTTADRYVSDVVALVESLREEIEHLRDRAERAEDDADRLRAAMEVTHG